MSNCILVVPAQQRRPPPGDGSLVFALASQPKDSQSG